MLHFEWLDSNMFIQAQQEGHRQSSWYPANRYFSWYFPSQMERSWYFPSQIERSVAARAALEVTKWNAVHSKVGVAYVRLNKNKSDCNDRGKFSNQNCSILWRKPRLICRNIFAWSRSYFVVVSSHMDNKSFFFDRKQYCIVLKHNHLPFIFT